MGRRGRAGVAERLRGHIHLLTASWDCMLASGIEIVSLLYFGFARLLSL